MEQQVAFKIMTENDQNILNSGKAFNLCSFKSQRHIVLNAQVLHSMIYIINI